MGAIFKASNGLFLKVLTFFCSGGHYIGEFANGELEGEGSLFYKEGDEYSGGWTRNVKNGFGVYKWVSVRQGHDDSFGTLTLSHFSFSDIRAMSIRDNGKIIVARVNLASSNG